MKRARGPACTICGHKERERIEALRASGVSLDALAKKFKVGRDILWRHWRDHVSAEMRAHYLAGPATIEMLREKAAEENLSVLDYLGIARSLLVGQMTASSDAGDAYRVAVLSGRLVEVLREIGRITGEVERLGGAGVTINNTVAIMSDPRMIELQQGLLRIAREHPDARPTIVALLRGLDADPGPARGAPMIEGGARHAA